MIGDECISGAISMLNDAISMLMTKPPDGTKRKLRFLRIFIAKCNGIFRFVMILCC